MKDFKIEIVITFRNIYRVLPNQFLSYVADPPRGFASHLEKVMKRQWGSRRDTNQFDHRRHHKVGNSNWKLKLEIMFK